MKIFWISMECPYPPNSGGRNVVWNKIVNMAANNDIFLFSIIDSEAEKKYIAELESYCKNVFLYKRERNLKSVIGALKYPFPAISRWIKRMKLDIEKKCDSIKPDYIIVEFPQMMGILSNRILNEYPIVLSQHNIEHLAMKSIASGMKFGLKKTCYQFTAHQLEKYEEKIYRDTRLDLITFVSSSDKEYFEKCYGQKEKTMLLPIGTNEKMIEGPIDEKNIAFIAKMSYKPNEEAIRWFVDGVWSSIKKKVPNAKLYIVGKEPSDDIQKIQSVLKDVIVTGAVDSTENYYAKANLIIVPILTGGGVKVKLIEALGHGKIVVTTTKGIEGTDFIPNKHVLVANGQKEFAEMCVNALLHQELYNEMKVNSYRKVQDEYSWKSITKQFEEKLLKIKENA